MAVNTVNLDALIPRQDFALDVGRNTYSHINRLEIQQFDTGFILPLLRKPDFQRETTQWTSEKVMDLVKTFVENELIPAAILWQSGSDVFVIVGFHPLLFKLLDQWRMKY
jgi:hypothetical protein